MRKLSSIQIEQLKQLYLHKISFKDVHLHNTQKENLFSMVKKQEDKTLLEYILAYYYHAGFNNGHCPALQELIVADWHDQHMEIARVMQLKICCQGSVRPLVKAIENKYEYLFYQGDYYSFVRQCFFAIGSLRTKEAKEKLAEYLDDTDPKISELAQEQLSKLAPKG